MLLILKSICILFWFCTTAVLTFFSVHCWITKKDLKLGFSQMPATSFDMFIITIIPFVCLYLGYALCELLV